MLWPAIVADAYSHRASLPTHLATVEAFEAMRDDLAADGLLFVNILGSENEAKFRTRIDRTIRRVFADCETWSRSANAEPAAWAADDDEQHDNLLYRCPAIRTGRRRSGIRRRQTEHRHRPGPAVSTCSQHRMQRDKTLQAGGTKHATGSSSNNR